MKKEIILNEDGSLFKKVDFHDDLIIRIKIIKGELTQNLYYKNEHGGMSKIDEYGICTNYIAFPWVNKLLSELVSSQCKKRTQNLKTTY